MSAQADAGRRRVRSRSSAAAAAAFAVADAVAGARPRVVLFALRGWADPQRVAAYRHPGRVGQAGWFCRRRAPKAAATSSSSARFVRPPIWRCGSIWGTLGSCRAWSRPSAAATTICSPACRGCRAAKASGWSAPTRSRRKSWCRRARSAAAAIRARSRRHRARPSTVATPSARSMSARRRWSPTTMCWRSKRPKAPTDAGARGGTAPRRPIARRRRGVLVKAPKPGQDRRFDLPGIGPRTIEGVARAGLAGLAVWPGEPSLPSRSASRPPTAPGSLS